MTGIESPRLLIEDWLPVAELGIESRRERAIAMDLPPLYALHVWWARRPLVTCSGVILGSLLPSWSPRLVGLAESPAFQDEATYHRWVLRLCGITGDPIRANRVSQAHKAAGTKAKANPFDYKQAFKNSPSTDDLQHLHAVLRDTWGTLPSVIDPTAGGGSIPYSAVRLGMPAIANDLNSVAASVLRATVEVSTRYGSDEFGEELEKWAISLRERIESRLKPYFPEKPSERITNYFFARTVACPRTGKPVPLAPNWWISRSAGEEVAVVVLTSAADGTQLDAPLFDLRTGDAARAANPDVGTVTRGTAMSPWDGLVIDGDYLKSEAQAGRMGSVLYGVATRMPVSASGRTKWVRAYRAPSSDDIQALEAAEAELATHWSDWLARGVLPAEEVVDGHKTAEPLRYGIRKWTDMFSPRQLLVHASFVDEFQRLVPELRAAYPDDRGKADAILGLLGLMHGKALNYNSLLSTWHAGRGVTRSVFDTHNLAFKWTFVEFEASRDLFGWVLGDQLVRAFRGVHRLLLPRGKQRRGGVGEPSVEVPAAATVIRGSAGQMSSVPDASQALVCIDPPYYDNVMYGELSDFFGVWEQHTVGMAWPDLMPGGHADLKNEAVANPSRFKDFGRRRGELATADYEAKMQAIFAECRRVLRSDGVLTVMFTHKRAEAWDTLGMALLEAGFSIETSWPVNTEPEQSLHQARVNSAASTIMLVCRKRPDLGDRGKVFFEDIEAEVRSAARDAAQRFEVAGIDGVDLLLATYGPALSVLSRAWPVYSSETDDDGRSRLLRPEEALGAAREEVVRLRKAELVGRDVAFDGITDFVLIAWQTFRAEEFPYDEARRLALAIGGGDVETLAAAKVLDKKAGSVRLLSPKERKRKVYRPVLDGEMAGLPLVDVLHAVLIEASESSLGAAKALCDRLRLLEDQRFVDLIQAMVRAVPNTKVKGKWVRPEAEILHQFCTAYLPQVELPEDPTSDTLFELD
jgi:adenine-specific DNA methylase